MDFFLIDITQSGFSCLTSEATTPVFLDYAVDAFLYGYKIFYGNNIQQHDFGREFCS